MSNYPDDCGPNKRCPWDEPEPKECPICYSSMTLEDIYLICDSEECDHTICVVDD